MTAKAPSAYCSRTAFDSLTVRVDALAHLLTEHENRNRERFEAARERVDLALISADKALAKAEASTERRLEAMNEFRGALFDHTTTLLPRNEYSLAHSVVLEKIDRVTERIASLEAGAKRQTAGISILGAIALGGFAFVSSMAAIATTFIHWMK